MTRKLLYILCIVFCTTINLNAQAELIKYKIKQGDKFLSKGINQYENALINYKDALNVDPKNPLTNTKVGNVYFLTERYSEAIPYLEQAVNVTGDKSSEAQFLLARSYQLTSQNDKAIEAYRRFLEAFTANPKLSADERYAKTELINMYIKQARNAKELMEAEIPVLTQNLGSIINSAYPDYAPVGTNDMKTMYFTSRRPGSTGGKKDNSDKFDFEDIYVSTQDDNGEWSHPKLVPGYINTNNHEATVTLSNDGTRMIIYKPNNKGNLYESTFSLGEWSKPKELKGVNSKYREVDASFSPDGNTIYFTSNNPNYALNGSMDILVSTRQWDGTWAQPSNLGADINTNYDELYVHVTPDGQTLYFSSEGHNSIGGFDIFRCTMLENGKWSKPENVGYPINSIFDDLSMYFSKDGKLAWFDSDREGGFGYKDIYQTINLTGRKKMIYVEVREKGSNKLLSAQVELIPVKVTTKDTVKLVAGKDLIYQKEANVYEKFNLVVSKNHYATETKEISTFFKSVDSLETPIKEVVYLELAPDLIFKGKAFDIATTNPVSKAAVEVWTKKAKVAETVTNNDGSFSMKLKNKERYLLVVRKEGYTQTRDTFLLDTLHLDKRVPLTKIKLNQKFELKDVFFDLNKATLRPESEAELTRLKAALLENPNMIIEISAHTDNVGQKTYNQKLSENRAKSVVSWMVDNGIPSYQMTAKGYGMAQPIVPNTNEENRQRNRRVEFKIIKLIY